MKRVCEFLRRLLPVLAQMRVFFKKNYDVAAWDWKKSLNQHQRLIMISTGVVRSLLAMARFDFANLEHTDDFSMGVALSMDHEKSAIYLVHSHSYSSFWGFHFTWMRIYLQLYKAEANQSEIHAHCPVVMVLLLFVSNFLKVFM